MKEALDQKLAERILSFKVRGDQIEVFRQNGMFESYDLATGARRAVRQIHDLGDPREQIHPPGIEPIDGQDEPPGEAHPPAEPAERTPDGRYSIHWEAYPTLALTPVHGGETRRFQLPESPDEEEFPISISFDQDGFYYSYLQCGKALYFSYAGAVQRIYLTQGIPECVSPDGKLVVFNASKLNRFGDHK